MANTTTEQVKLDIEESKKPQQRKEATVEIGVDNKYEGCFNAWGEMPDDYVSYDKTFDSMAEFAKYADAFLKL